MVDTQNRKALACPCCLSLINHTINNVFVCPHCHHVWKDVDPHWVSDHYLKLTGRNELPDKYVEKKLLERVEYLAPYLRTGMSVLEIGCAEGELGKKVKEKYRLEYYGFEISQDAIQAQTVLDGVFRLADQVSEERKFDLIMSFHVLEHISDLSAVIVDWKHWLKPDGIVILEVPNNAGHPWVEDDNNPEHIHQFGMSSIAALLQRHGFIIKMMSTGFFESPSYTDSIRLVAELALSRKDKQDSLIEAIRKTIHEPFDVFCVGGDFKSYIEPIMPHLNVISLFDNDAMKKEMGGKPVILFENEKNEQRPILIASIRYEEHIRDELLQKKVSLNNIYYLSDILLGVNSNG